MHNHSSNANLRTDKRFEVLIKQQVWDHEHVISNHNKEMQSLRDALSLAIEKFDAISKQTQQELKEKTEAFNQAILILNEKLKTLETVSLTHDSRLKSISQETQDLHTIYVTKSDMEKLKGHISCRVDEVTNIQLGSCQSTEQGSKALFNLMKDHLVKLETTMNNKFDSISEYIDGEACISRIDKEGVLKEIRMYEKDIFIIERKLENIYTLIDRINKGNASCHKPV
jgi:hypothetical protein